MTPHEFQERERRADESDAYHEQRSRFMPHVVTAQNLARYEPGQMVRVNNPDSPFHGAVGSVLSHSDGLVMLKVGSTTVSCYPDQVEPCPLPCTDNHRNVAESLGVVP